MKFGLNDKTLQKFHFVFSQFPEIDEVILYGSRAMGSYREGSDIDITLKGEDVDDGISSRIYWDLDDLNSPYLIDLSVYHMLDSATLLDHIDRWGKCFTKRNCRL